MLTYHKTTEEEKEVITAWQYAGQYAIYNTTPYAEQKKQGVGFANPKTISIRSLIMSRLLALSICMKSQPRSSLALACARMYAAGDMGSR